MKMRKILVLGGNGFLGRNLCNHLVAMGEDVYSFDMSLPEIGNPEIHYIEGDFFDDYTLKKIIEGMDVIFHAICTLNPGNSNENVYWDMKEILYKRRNSVRLLRTQSVE